MNFVFALAYHFCLNLPAAFTQPGARLLVEPCIARRERPSEKQEIQTKRRTAAPSADVRILHGHLLIRKVMMVRCKGEVKLDHLMPVEPLLF